MDLAIHLALLTLGFVLLVKGADYMIRGATALAKRFGISELVIGLTVVAFGTSMPEMVVNTISAVKGFPDVVFGNVIGSNNFNLFAILGIAGLIYPLKVQTQTAKKEIPFSLVTTIIFMALANDAFFSDQPNSLTITDGLVLGGCFLVFLYYIYRSIASEKQIQKEVSEIVADVYGPEAAQMKTWMMVLFIIGGLAGLMFGGQLVVDNAVAIAKTFQVSDKLIALTIVAAGTSLPELAASAVAAFRKSADIAVGNIVGSNIFNILLVLAVSSFASGGMTFDAVFNTDLALLLFGTVLLLAFMKTGKVYHLDRFEAFLLLLTFIGYTAFLIYRG